MDHALTFSAPDYNFKVPRPLRFALPVGAVLAVVSLLSIREHWLLLGFSALVVTLLLASVAAMLFLITDPGRRAVACNRMVGSVSWSGTERVLDVGCGNGLVLLAAAKHLRENEGKATGIDIWLEIAGQQNLERLRRNAEIEGVADRIEFREADARQMPFDSAVFDVVFASLSLHHAGNKADRKRVLTEIKRVLRPGGAVFIYDMFPIANEASQTLRQIGIKDIQRLSGRFLQVLSAKNIA